MESACCVHYRTFPRCTVEFSMKQGHTVCVELLDGSAYVQQDGRVNNLLQKEYYHMQSLKPSLHSNDGCSFKVYGRHTISSSEGQNKMVQTKMFRCVEIDSNVVFYIGRQFQLLVFHREEIRRVTLEILCGSPLVLGSVFPTGRGYYLPPYSHVLVKNHSGISYSYCAISIKKPTERFDFLISPYETEIWANVKAVQALIYHRLQNPKEKCFGPKILVLGARTISKISFCHYILNNALQKNFYPTYVDLNVRENLIGIPGSLRIIQVRGRYALKNGRRHVSSVYSGPGNVFSFGNVDPESNIKLYYFLLNRLAAALAIFDEREEGAKYAGTVIDMCDSLSSNATAIKRVVRAFHVNMLIVIGDEDLYQRLLSERTPHLERFIPPEEDFEPLNYNLHNGTLQDYFLQNRNVFPIKFSDIEICEILSEGAADNIKLNTVITDEDFQVVRITCGKHLENHVLGVSAAYAIDRHIPRSRLKYFVFIMGVDTENETLTIMSPKSECLSGAILIKGDIKCQMQNEA